MARYPLVGQLYISAVGLGAVLAVLWLALFEGAVLREHFWAIVVLGLAASGGSFFLTRLSSNCTVDMATVVHAFAFLTFPAPVAVAGAVLEGLVYAVLSPIRVQQEETERPSPWHIVLYNAAQGIVSVAVVATSYRILTADLANPFASPRGALLILGAGLLYYFVNTGLIALAVALCNRRGIVQTWRTAYARLFLEYLGMLSAGTVLAILWRDYPWMTPAVAALIVVIRRSLRVPVLQEDTRHEAKTRLYNAEHFTTAVGIELRRAARKGHPLAVIMADLDYLREVNNAYGHLAGDVVVKGVAEILRAGVREYDVAARFGGDEFSILLPEAGKEEALRVAERIRRQVESASFVAPETGTPIHVTISLGVACYPVDGRTAEALLHQADLALYQAKQASRNRTCAASSELPAPPKAEPPPPAPRARPVETPRTARRPYPSRNGDVPLPVHRAPGDGVVKPERLPVRIRTTEPTRRPRNLLRSLDNGDGDSE